MFKGTLFVAVLMMSFSAYSQSNKNFGEICGELANKSDAVCDLENAEYSKIVDSSHKPPTSGEAAQMASALGRLDTCTAKFIETCSETFH